VSFEPQDLNVYPEEPGVYLMKDKGGKILYVGKAKNLRARLKQYFGKHGDNREMVPYLTAQVETIDTVVTLTEKDALILEDQLIKQHWPKYNVLLKDDKTFVRLLMTRHKWPMLRLIRTKEPNKKEGTYFGPYTNALAARQMLDLVQTLFPLRQCSDAELANRIRPCLLYDMKRCLAPCVGKCTEADYEVLVAETVRLLKGQDKSVVEELIRRRDLASDALEFEKAEEIHRLITQIEHVTQSDHVDLTQIDATDVIGHHAEGGALMVALLQFRNSRLIASEHFSYHLIASTAEEALASFILQHYKYAAEPPKEILVSLNIPYVAEIVSEAHGKKIDVSVPKRGSKRDLVEMAMKNASALFTRENEAKSLQEKMLLDLQETLKLNRYPKRIECFDTSSIGQTNAVASLACFIDGKRDKSLTRLFRIKEAKPGDDYGAMREVIGRHLKRLKETNVFPDLLIVDGGKGQLGVAIDVLKELGIASIDVIALTKDDARHDKGITQEKVYLPYRSDPILIEKRSPLLFLLQRIRDEAHRLAIDFQRKKFSESTLTSALDGIPGIGPKKKRALLAHFGSVKAIQDNDPERLGEVKELNQRDIATIKNWILKTKKTI
jgi:excinuclease ABC subunit C